MSVIDLIGWMMSVIVLFSWMMSLTIIIIFSISIWLANGYILGFSFHFPAGKKFRLNDYCYGFDWQIISAIEMINWIFIRSDWTSDLCYWYDLLNDFFDEFVSFKLCMSFCYKFDTYMSNIYKVMCVIGFELAKECL